MKLEADEDVAKAAVAHFTALADLTAPHVPAHLVGRYKPLSFTVRDEGVAVAGIYGYAVYDFAVLEVLWVLPEYRGQKIGQILFRKFEIEALLCECRTILLSTLSYHRATEFWRRQGFQVIGRLDDSPQGGFTQYMHKVLKTENK